MTPQDERRIEGSRIWQTLPEETQHDVYALVHQALTEAHGDKDAAEDWLITYVAAHQDQALVEDIARATCLAVIEEVWRERRAPAEGGPEAQP